MVSEIYVVTYDARIDEAVRQVINTRFRDCSQYLCTTTYVIAPRLSLAEVETAFNTSNDKDFPLWVFRATKEEFKYRNVTLESLLPSQFPAQPTSPPDAST